MKPIAIDLGRNYWVMARMDAYGQPEVASVGEGGQIPAVISEYNGELLPSDVLPHFALIESNYICSVHDHFSINDSATLRQDF